MKPGDAVNMNCRAKKDCEGRVAVMVFKKQLTPEQGGGTAIRYRCTKCNGAWHVRF